MSGPPLIGISTSEVRFPEGIDQTEKWGDVDSSDLLTEISRCADKYLYFLEAHLRS